MNRNWKAPSRQDIRLSACLPSSFKCSWAEVFISDIREYCTEERFQSSCADDEVILIQHAKYGRMKLGNCITGDFGFIGKEAFNLLSEVRKSMHQICWYSHNTPKFRKWSSYSAEFAWSETIVFACRPEMHAGCRHGNGHAMFGQTAMRRRGQRLHFSILRSLPPGPQVLPGGLL